MKDILITRLMRLKKHGLSLCFWLVFPVLVTFLVIYGTEQAADDISVPVGVIADEPSTEAEALIEDMRSTGLIRLEEMNELRAKSELKKNKLDSAFKIPDDYAENIKDGRRQYLLDSYHSNQSFAYTPVKETVISYVGESVDRSRAAKVLDDLAASYGEEGKWQREDILETSKEIQTEQDLLQVALSMKGSPDDREDSGSALDIWAIWASLNLLATLLLFDWVIHERRSGVGPRFAFMRFSFKHYLLINAGLYFLMSLILDIGTMLVFEVVLNTTVPFWTIFSFQLFLSLGAFLLAHLFKRPFVYYMVSFAIALLIAIGSGTILPNQGLIQGFPCLMQLSPLQPFLDGGYVNVFSGLVIIAALVWYLKRGTSRVTR